VFLVAVTVAALVLLFALTALALGAADELPHPHRVAVVLVMALLIGLAMLYEYGESH
jgi:hypothetical protein